ncbi:peroxiredoxin [Hydrogenovibrio sp. 3SP14C1]|uniref:peroxiredoxin n=1 Tax=Hydrogenovibrio sp. 3SP14C1 TaxID=3038774 RepID=UPI0024173E02|nr:peroxiredoxin [Hydrogenovibrio sp. 3SP14C1]MDG4813345.1 peroxiredoxin [Hydrogenovibrio sp. 3SP14C1]
MTTTPLQIGQKIPTFSLDATNGQTVTENDLTGHYTIIYFYPKDDTPGCTTEGQDFTQAYSDFKAENTTIYGVSRDSIKKHENFKSKFDFPFELISDPDETLCKIFDIIKLKKNYGKEYMGIERSTFLINPEGELIQEWRKVKVPEHATEVLEAVKNVKN